MLQPSTLQFFEDLKAHNHKAWFDEHRPRYEAARSDVLALTEALIAELTYIDPSISELALDPRRCLTRINRDIRFSRDKSPYKPMMVIMLGKDRRHYDASCYFVFIEPGNCFVGAGGHHPAPDHLKKIRQEIYYEADTWASIVGDPGFRKYFPDGIRSDQTLKRVPKDFEEDHPAGAYLKMKSFYVTHTLTDNEMTCPNVREKIIACFEAAQPLVSFLHRALDSEPS